MQTILDVCCGLDVHKDSACIIKTNLKSQNKDDVQKEIMVFKTFLDDLNNLRNWLETEDCHHVAMESTGVYWFPVFDVLATAHRGNCAFRHKRTSYEECTRQKNQY